MIKQGQLYIVSAPSGAGKSSLIAELLKGSMKENIRVSISHTTRAIRPGEEDTKHYFFIDNATFEGMIEKESFVEYAKVFDHYYGTSYAAIKDYLEQGIDVFLDIDWQGARQVREKFSTARSIFILPPSREALKERLVNRGQDKPEVIEKRMAKAIAEMSHFDEYDYLVVNDDFTRAVEDIQAILQAERLQRSRQVQCYQQLIDNLLAE